MILYFRSLAFFIFFFGLTFLLSFVYILTLILPRKVALYFYKLWASLILAAFHFLVGVRVVLKGKEHLTRQPLILVSQHQSTWETLFLVLLLKDPTYILKKELLYIPLFGLFLWKSKMIAIQRKKRKKSMQQILEKADECFSYNRSLIIFPEGTRLPVGERRPFKYGVVALYKYCNEKFSHIPVMPVALNSGACWSRRSLMLRPGVIQVTILPPIKQNLSDKDFIENLQNAIWDEASRIKESEKIKGL